jgi:peptidyl-prolyl cis-trans isomerase D
MALIGTLRTKMTKWVVGAVALAMGAFIVGSDLFGSGPRSIFGGNRNTVGEIAGSSISLEEFQATVQERENNYILSFGRQPGERELPTLRQQAWDLLIARKAIVPQYEKVGVEVTSDEVWDMIQGKNVDENVKSSFIDSAGNFDRNRLIQYLQSINSMPAGSDARVRWDIFKADLMPARARIKYENLIIKTGYVTEAEAEKDYHTQNDVAEIKFLYVPFFAISDSAVKISDSDLKAYYEKNKKKYKTTETRSMSYVAFPVAPSAQDSAEIRTEMERLAADFKTTQEDSLFAVSNSDGTNPYSKYTAGNLPANLNPASLVEGAVEGPFIDGGSYKITKVVKIGKDTTYSARASHILIRWDDTSDAAKKAAKEKARKILNEIKGGADFAAKAREFGTDGTASKGGDLGWFTSGQMVKPFEKAVFDAKKTGVLNDVVETDFGYHIIEVTGVKDNSFYAIATIEREITPSDETQNEAFRKADAFTNGISGIEDFKEKAKKENLVVNDANNIGTAERRINNLGEARSAILWLFRDAKVGKVSEVFDLDDVYVVAVMTGETEEGYKSLDLVKEEITPLVRNEAKGKMLVDKINAQKGSLDEMAKATSPDATVATSSDLKLNSNSLPTAGFDPVAVGKAFNLENGKRTKPFAGENGVFVIELQNKTIAPAVGDYSIFKNQLKQAQDAKNYNIMEAVKEGSNIKDARYKFY